MTEPENPQPADPPSPEVSAPEGQLRVWRSESLLGDNAEAIILHAGVSYRLRHTKQGKLVLYK